MSHYVCARNKTHIGLVWRVRERRIKHVKSGHRLQHLIPYGCDPSVFEPKHRTKMPKVGLVLPVKFVGVKSASPKVMLVRICVEKGAFALICVKNVMLACVCVEKGALARICVEKGVLVRTCGEKIVLALICVWKGVIDLICVENVMLAFVCLPPCALRREFMSARVCALTLTLKPNPNPKKR